jgi:HSP20 family protein
MAEMKALAELKHGLEDVWDSVSEGWRRLRESAAGALTRFKPGGKSSLPAHVDDDLDLSSPGWALLAGDVFEDGKNVVVWLEVPGMGKDDFDIEVRDNSLIVRGEKRFEREASVGRYHVMQCAYGTFYRAIPLPAHVTADKAKATYRKGILKIALPKAKPEKGKTVDIRVG